MAKSRISIAKSDIVNLFDEYPEKVFTLSQLHSIFQANRRFWRLARSMSCLQFINYLIQNSRLKKLKFDFAYRSMVVYVWGEVSLYTTLLSLKRGSYFSHYTALYFHELTDQVPRTIYFNVEQRAKPRSKGSLAQLRIDAAFKRPTRLSGNIAEHGDQRLCLLNGMFTGELGVVEMDGPDGSTVRATDIERTLIDTAVRPEYAGGPFEVLRAYKVAKDQVSINRLAATLKKLDHIYQYHQVVGFYLDRCGAYDKSQIVLFSDRFQRQYDFYLMHQMKDCDYSAEWKLYFPKGLG